MPNLVTNKAYSITYANIINSNIYIFLTKTKDNYSLYISTKVNNNSCFLL